MAGRDGPLRAWKKFYRRYRSKSFLVLVIPAVILGVAGFLLERAAIPGDALPSGQIFVTVYVSTDPANVSLTSYSYLAPQDDSISVSVTGRNGVRDPWILVVQCPPGGAPSSAPQLYSEGTQGRQHLGDVIVSNHNKKTYAGSLGCFRHSKPSQAVPGANIDVTLPVLEQNPAAQATPAQTPLYVERNASGQRTIEDLVEVLEPPDSSCLDPASTTSSASSYSSGSCYSAVAAGTADTRYLFPSSTTTFETLENVNLANYNTPSMFPPGQITSDGKVKWQGSAPLSPSLSATSQQSARNASIDNFAAGVLLGLCGGFLVPFIQGLLPSGSGEDDDADPDDAAKGQAQPQRP
jgi:hypothetical protein